MAVIAWAVGVVLVAAWTFAPAAPPPQIVQMPELNRDEAIRANEDLYIKIRNVQRKSTFRALEQPWGGRCIGESRKAFLAGIGHYYYFRQAQTENYTAYFGKPGADYIARQWATTDDQRIERLTQDAYTKGYLKPADFVGPANRLIAMVVKDERVTGKACAD
jgi:hypothetical protein